MDNFSIFKNKDKAAKIEMRVNAGEDVMKVKEDLKNLPDFRINFKNQEGEYVEWGACWWKKDKQGNFFQSCAKKKEKITTDDGNEIPF